MLDISATETFTDGAELFDQEKYQSTVTTSIEPDPIQMEQDFNKPLSQRIISIHSPTKDIYGEYRLDDVMVRCPAEAYREHEKQQWTAVKKEAEEKYSSRTYIALVSGACAAISAVFWSMNSSYVVAFYGISLAISTLGPMLCLAGTVSTFFFYFLAASANSAYYHANDQINKWNADPVMKVGHARNEAHKQGFPYIYANQLKLGQGPSRTALFHPIQVEHEYKKYFESFYSKLRNLSSPSIVSWMNQFRSCNPISSEYMLYGLGHIPDRMKLVIEDYTRLASLLEDIAKSYDQLKIDVRKTAKERIDSYTKTKNEQLQPLAQARDEGIADAEAVRDRVLRDLGASERRQQEARETFTAINEALQESYTRSAAPINKKYDGKIKEVERERDERLSKLDGQKDSQLGNNYRAARELLERAKQAWDNRGYQPVNFQQYFPYQTTEPVWGHQQPISYTQPVPPVYQQPQAPVYPQPVTPVYQRPQTPVYPQPVTPVYQRPQTPVYPQPVQPVHQQPQAPVYPQPVTPVYQQPQAPVYPQPVTPVYQQPQAPVYPQPVQPVYQQQQASIPQAQNVHPKYDNPGYGQFGYGHTAQIPAQPTAPQRRG